MKKYKGLIIFSIVIILLIIVALVFSDNPDKYIKDISYSEVIKKKNNKDAFILYIKSTNCEHCKAYTPKFTSVLKRNKLKAYSLNIANLSENDQKKYNNEFNVDGTPTVLFIEEGNESIIRIEGDQTKEVTQSKLKAAGYIK